MHCLLTDEPLRIPGTPCVLANVWIELYNRMRARRYPGTDLTQEEESKNRDSEPFVS